MSNKADHLDIILKALLDTNIVIHRESNRIQEQQIGTLFRWLERASYEKCIHPITVAELNKYNGKQELQTLEIKLHSYYKLKTTAPLAVEVKQVSDKFDKDSNDHNDTLLLNEVYQNRVDILISEDKKIHRKALELEIDDRVFNIDSFLEKVVSENPELVNYDVLSISKRFFGDIDLKDRFFDSFRRDYKEFDEWFNKKADDIAYITYNDGRVLSFLYLKVEPENEDYRDIYPVFTPKKRLKVGTLKVLTNGLRLGERFLKIIFDNALQYNVDEIYVTVFEKTDEQIRLIDLLYDWGFTKHGYKNTENGEELVLVRNFQPRFIPTDPMKSFPYISSNATVYLCPIYERYHTELFPDSILTTESPMDFKESLPHRNGLRKVYISRSIHRDLKLGDIIVFYRTGGYYKSVVTTIGLVESVTENIANYNDFVLKCRKRSIFTNDELKEWWDYRPANRPFIVNFLYVYSFPKRPNLQRLIEIGVIKSVNDAPRGFVRITNDQLRLIIKESESDESIIVD